MVWRVVLLGFGDGNRRTEGNYRHERKYRRICGGVPWTRVCARDRAGTAGRPAQHRAGRRRREATACYSPGIFRHQLKMVSGRRRQCSPPPNAAASASSTSRLHSEPPSRRSAASCGAARRNDASAGGCSATCEAYGTSDAAHTAPPAACARASSTSRFGGASTPRASGQSRRKPASAYTIAATRSDAPALSSRMKARSSLANASRLSSVEGSTA